MINKIKELYSYVKWYFINKDETIFWGWLIWIWEKKTDWIFGSTNVADLLNDLEALERQPIYEYNQWAQYETRNYCTIYSALTQLSYLFDYKFTLCQIKEIGNRMIRDWKLDPNYWAYLSDAIDYTRKWWNENFPERLINSYRVRLTEPNFREEVLSKATRLIQIGYRTSSELYRELQDKWYAMEKDYPKVGGHAVSMYWLNIIDNYKWRNKKNRYSFHYFGDLVENWVIFKNWYIFLKQKK